MSHWGENLLPKMYLFFMLLWKNRLILILSILQILIILYNKLNKYKLKEGKIIEKIINLDTIILNKTKRSDVINFKEPLNNIIISIIYGSLLGEANISPRRGELSTFGGQNKVKNNKGSRITFYQESSHKEYLYFIHRLIANLGYCNTNIPKIKTKIGKNGKLKYFINFSTWSYEQFNELKLNWYNDANIKIIPYNFEIYFSPLTLAIWIMNNGRRNNSGLVLLTNSFNYNEVLYLIDILYKRYSIKADLLKTNNNNQFNISINPSSMNNLINIVNPYIIPSMKYKILSIKQTKNINK